MLYLHAAVALISSASATDWPGQIPSTFDSQFVARSNNDDQTQVSELTRISRTYSFKFDDFGF